MASPIAGSSRKSNVLRARMVTWLPSRAKACASSTATTDEPTTASRGGIRSLASASVEVQYGVSVETRHRRDGGARAGRHQAAVERHQSLAALAQRHRQRLPVPEARLAVHDRDGGVAGQHALVLGVAQFVHPVLLLREQRGRAPRRRVGRQADVERALSSQVRDVGGSDQDFGRHAPDVDAGPADDAALDQRDRAPSSAAFSAAAIAPPPLPMTAMCSA